MFLQDWRTLSGEQKTALVLRAESRWNIKVRSNNHTLNLYKALYAYYLLKMYNIKFIFYVLFSPITLCSNMTRWWEPNPILSLMTNFVLGLMDRLLAKYEKLRENSSYL